jgi:hypothetical protein
METETRPCTCDHPDWHDPFSELRTFPSGWGLTELPRYERSLNSDQAFVVAGAPDALPAQLIEGQPDPFPEAGGFPSGWDLADVLALEHERMEALLTEQEPVGFLLPLSVDRFTGYHA